MFITVKALHDNPMNNQSAFYMHNQMYVNHVKKVNADFVIFYANGQHKVVSADTKIQVVGS